MRFPTLLRRPNAMIRSQCQAQTYRLMIKKLTATGIRKEVNDNKCEGRPICKGGSLCYEVCCGQML